jgi:hypothetical protein
MRKPAPISLRPALLVSVVALESEFKIRETPCLDQFDVKVIEQTGDIVSGDGYRLTTPFSALIKKVLPQGWARDLMRRDALITSTRTKIWFEANSYCQESRLVVSRSEREPNG